MSLTIVRHVSAWLGRVRLSEAANRYKLIVVTSQVGLPVERRAFSHNVKEGTKGGETTRAPFRRNKKLNVKSIFVENVPAAREADFDETVVNEEESNDGAEEKPRFMFDSPTIQAFNDRLAEYDGFQFGHKDWEALERAACSENPQLKRTWEGVCMSLLCAFPCADLATSLLSYQASKNRPPKILTLCLYMSLQGRFGGKEKERIILDTFAQVSKLTDVFEAVTAKHVIVGLAATSQWRKALDILKELDLMGSVSRRACYSPVIATAFRENQSELAFRLLEELGWQGFDPTDAVLLQVLECCAAAGEHSLLEGFLALVWKFNWQLSQDMAQKLEEYFTGSSTEKWSCKWTAVDKVRGTCHGCKQDLQRMELSTADFEALQREFFERTVVGSNVYLKSNPEEVERFRDFMMENAPFDVVLDALNIASRHTGKGKHPFKSRTLQQMVYYFSEQRHMRILMIGRAHMKMWNAHDMNYINSHAKTFFTDNISSDDLFCLYATLFSGKDCMFVSGDFMRDHLFLMGAKLKEIFRRWQRSRQIINFQPTARGLTVQMPSQYDFGPIQDDSGWHIPFNDGNNDPRLTSQSVLCLRYKGKSKAADKRNQKVSGINCNTYFS